MTTGEPLLGGAALRELLEELGRRCAAKGLAVEMYIVGGAAMAVAYDRERTTRDIDAVFEPKMAVYEEARLMAADLGLAPDWLNDGVKGLLPDFLDPQPRPIIALDGMRVSVASPECLFAMKAAAARPGADLEDLLALAKILGVTSAERANDIVSKFYRPARLQVRTSLLLRSLFGPAPGPPGSVAGPAGPSLAD